MKRPEEQITIGCSVREMLRLKNIYKKKYDLLTVVTLTFENLLVL